MIDVAILSIISASVILARQDRPYRRGDLRSYGVSSTLSQSSVLRRIVPKLAPAQLKFRLLRMTCSISRGLTWIEDNPADREGAQYRFTILVDK